MSLSLSDVLFAWVRILSSSEIYASWVAAVGCERKTMAFFAVRPRFAALRWTAVDLSAAGPPFGIAESPGWCASSGGSPMEAASDLAVSWLLVRKLLLLHSE